MKKLVSLSMALALGASILQGCGSKTGSAKEFTASSKGFGGDVTITAIVENGKILSATAEGKSETEGKGSLAIDSFNNGELGVKSGNDIASSSVDSLSGATVTSSALQTAWKSIIKQAAGNTDSKKTTMKEGTYTETVYGNNYSRPFEVTVTLGKDSIDDIQVTDIGGETQEIIQTVIDNLIPRIKSNQSLAVDSITGATASSGGVKTAVKNAIDEAGGDSSEWYDEIQYKSDIVELDGYDTIVVGLGGTGVSAFLSASDAGASVIGVEAAAKVGGTSATVGGPMAINPKNPSVQPESGTEGYPIDTDAFEKQWIKDTNGDAKKECIDIMMNDSGSTLDWMIEDHGFSFTPLSSFMIYPYILYSEYDIQNTITQMYVNALDEACKKNEKNKYLTEVKAEKILSENGKITGIEARGADGTIYKIHAKSVILATGGFGGNAELTKKYTGTKMNLYGMYQNDGTMLAYAVENLNADTYNIGTAGITHLARTTVDLKDSSVTPSHQKTLDAIVDSTDVLHVDEKGNRFTQGDRAEDITENAHKAGDYFWSIVSDEYMNDIKENGLNQVYMMLNVQDGSLPIMAMIDPSVEIPEENAKYILKENDPITDIDKIISIGEKMGIVVEADSLEELAEKTGATDLKETVEKYNSYAKDGNDPEFNKDKENLKEVSGKKYYAIKGTGYSYSTCGGLNVNENIEVLDKDGNVIPGLYAAGTDSMGVLLSETTGYIDYGGIDHGWCLTSGKIAGENAAKYASK
jgi:FMN-binding domain protein